MYLAGLEVDNFTHAKNDALAGCFNTENGSITKREYGMLYVGYTRDGCDPEMIPKMTTKTYIDD